MADAHEYLLKHFSEFDFIWSSPPCQTHSQIRYNIGYKANRRYEKVKAVFPDMTLYQEILFLKGYFEGKWCIENTIAWYEPLIIPQNFASHWFWANFLIRPLKGDGRNHRGGTVETLQDKKTLDISGYNIPNKRQILRNCVEPQTGKRILECVIDPIETQASLL